MSGVIIAIGLAKWHHEFKWVPALLCLAFALLAQIVSNMANEYFDYLKGTDKPGRVGPRRGVTEGDITPTTLRNATLGMLAAAGVVGCCLIPYGGWWLLPVGILIALGAFAYSAGPYPLSYHGMGELMEQSLPDAVEEEILRLAATVPGVEEPHELCTRRIGNHYAIELHILMDGGISLNEAHEKASEVEDLLRERYGEETHIAVHVEPK